MEAFSQIIAAACAEGTIPGAVVAATNSTGSLFYTEAFGKRSLVDGQACGLDTVMAFFSVTKLVTTIAALQLVEGGKIGLDDDISKVLPELSSLPVLDEMKDGQGVLRERVQAITIRNLLTHSSGLAYPFMVPKLAQYNQSIGLPPFSPPTTVTKSYDAPLAFEPGKSWTYSTGMDWVGVLISRVSGLDLETYFQKHIFMPLGITDITFWPKKNSLLESRMASLSMRDPAVLQNAGKAVPNKGHNMQANIQEEFGGQGLYGSMPSYLKILKSVLIDDEQLLKTTTSALMFEPQLTPESQQALQSVFSNQPAAGPCSIGYFPSNIKYDWGLGGILSCEDMHDDQFNYRKKGCLNWSGMSNIFWFLDRAAGVCGIFGLQMLPAGDKAVKNLHIAFEKAVYHAGA